MNGSRINLEDKEIMRSFIKKEFCRRYNINTCNSIDILTTENIYNLIELYDTYILNSYLIKVIPEGIKVSTSNRMTSSGGKTIFSKRGRFATYEIRISNKIIEKFIEDKEVKIVCGIKAIDALEALMLILEHEICHVIEFSKYGISNCKGIRFKTMALDLFGHKSSYHEIFKNRENSKKTITKAFSKGQVVRFKYKDILYEGIISNINKRATVMVKDRNGVYEDKNGIKYSKWYIPLNLLMDKE